MNQRNSRASKHVLSLRSTYTSSIALRAIIMISQRAYAPRTAQSAQHAAPSERRVEVLALALAAKPKERGAIIHGLCKFERNRSKAVTRYRAGKRTPPREDPRM